METLPVRELMLMGAKYNPRVMPEGEMLALRKSLRVFGPVQPVIVNTRTKTIVGGHQRVRAASAEGMPDLPVIWVDLDDNQERELNLALNRIHGEWDEDLLVQVLSEIESGGGDLAATGFDSDEIDALLARLTATPHGATDADDVGEVPEEPITKHGDLWLLGRHRLMCGDSTSGPMVKRLVGEKPPDAMWTDPPYGVDYIGHRTVRKRIENDVVDGLGMLLQGAFENANAVLKPGAPIYVASPAGPRQMEFMGAFVAAGWLLRQTLVWLKDSFVIGHNDYHYKHEILIYGYKAGEGRLGRGSANWHGDNKQDSIFAVTRPYKSKEHPTMKPVELIERALSNSTQAGDVVLDLFSGSGSTLMACERTGRDFVGMEITPGYTDVIVKRWEAYTAKKAVLDEDPANVASEVAFGDGGPANE